MVRAQQEVRKSSAGTAGVVVAADREFLAQPALKLDPIRRASADVPRVLSFPYESSKPIWHAAATSSAGGSSRVWLKMTFSEGM
jgi:hypothetical protein